MLLNCDVGKALDCKEIQPINPKGNQSWIFIGRIDAEAKAPILWSPGVKNWLIGKDANAGKDWGQEEKGTTGWDGWMASLTWWTRIWASSKSWWWTGKPGMLHSQGVTKSCTQLSYWTELNIVKITMLSKALYRFSAIPIKMLMAFITKLE